MTGTHNFKDRLRGGAVLLALGGMSGPLAADDLRLADDSRLTGTVVEIRDNGSIKLDSPLAGEPLVLKPDAVKRVVFSDPFTVPDLPTARLELTNGDVLPVTVEALDGQTLTANSPVAGPLRVGREVIRSLQFGVYPDRYIYAGPKDDRSDWLNEGGGASWSFGDDELEIEGAGRITRVLPAADQFLVRFDFAWSGTPNIQFFFADPLENQGQASDRYYLQFNAAGMEVKRESKGVKRYTQVMQLSRAPGQYEDSRIQVEIRVDRRQQLLELLINGEVEARASDPIAGAPTGGGITVVSNAPEQTTQTFSNLELLHWNAAGDRHRTEERGNPKADALISTHGDRMEGALQEIRQTPEGTQFVFKSDFQASPAELAEAEVSTIFFAGEEKESEKNAHPFFLKLHGNGGLRVASCSFSGEVVQARHPLLGELALRRNGVTSLERRTLETPEKPEP